MNNAYRWIAPHNRVAARALVNRIKAAVALLATRPHIGRPGRVVATREFVVTGTPYIIPYRVADGCLHILGVHHNARLWPESFPPPGTA